MEFDELGEVALSLSSVIVTSPLSAARQSAQSTVRKVR